MRIKELAVRAGVSRYTIHYYLKEELLPPPLKTSKTTALYSDIHLDCLQFIRKLREEQGMPIAILRQEVKIRLGNQWEKASVPDGANSKGGTKGRQQRQRIIEKGIELFSSKGYYGTKVNDITDALNISKGTFYLYFEHKRDLLITVFNQIIEKLAKTEEKVKDNPDALERLLERARAYHPFFLKYHRIFDITRAESISNENKTELNIQVIYEKILNHVAKDIKQAREEGKFVDGPDDTELISYMVFGALDFALFRLLMDDKYSLEDILKIFKNYRLNLSPIDKR